MLRAKLSLFIALIVPTTVAGCASYKLEPPAGFAEVQKSKWGARMKGSEDVGLSVRVFHNVDGGTLAFWSEDLVRKLGKRGYELVGQSPARSKNGVPGTRFDFSYTQQGETDKKFYSVVLYATDKKRIIVALAGDQNTFGRFGRQVDQIASDIKVRGCKALTKVCKGPQPAKLQSPPDERVIAKDDPETDTAEGSSGADTESSAVDG